MSIGPRPLLFRHRIARGVPSSSAPTIPRSPSCPHQSVAIVSSDPTFPEMQPPPEHLLLRGSRGGRGGILPLEQTLEPATGADALCSSDSVVAPSGRVLTPHDLESRAKYADFGIVATALASTMANAEEQQHQKKKMISSLHRPLKRSPFATPLPPRSGSAEEETDAGSVSCSSSSSSAWTEASSCAS